MKFFAVFIFIVFGFQLKSKAQAGCNNGTRIYTQFLGTTTSGPDGLPHNVYSSVGYSIRIYNNEDGKNTPKCDEVRGSPKGWVDTGGPQCWIADRVPANGNNPTNSNGTGVSWQTPVYVPPSAYSKCNAPLDSHAIYVLSIFGIIGAYFLRRRFSLNPES